MRKTPEEISAAFSKRDMVQCTEEEFAEWAALQIKCGVCREPLYYHVDDGSRRKCPFAASFFVPDPNDNEREY